MSTPQGWGEPWVPQPEHAAAWGAGQLALPAGPGAPLGPPAADVAQDPRTHLPTVARQYHEFWLPRYDRWSKWALWILAGLGGILALGIALVAISIAFSLPAVAIDAANGVQQSAAHPVTTPALFIANDLGLAAMIPVSMLVSWALSRQRPKWLSSIEGGIRWRWLLKAALVIVPIFVICLGGLQLLGGTSGMHSNSSTVLMIFTVLLLTPFQAGAEEYMLRGVVTRIIGSWIPHRLLGFILAALVSAACFTYLHNAQDPWLNTFYFCFALTSSYLVWRTGGLEASIVMHAINNWIAEATMPWTDFSTMFDRSAGTGSPLGLIQVVICLFTIVGLELIMRFGKIRPRTQTAPGNPALDRELASGQAVPRVVTPAGTVAAPGTYSPNPPAVADPYGRPPGQPGLPYGAAPGTNGWAPPAVQPTDPRVGAPPPPRMAEDPRYRP